MRRNRKRRRYTGIIIGILLLLGLCLGLIYMFFIKPVDIACGIVLDKKETPKTISLKLYSDGKTKWVKVSKSINLPDSISYNVHLKGVRLVSISPSKVYTGKVFSKSKDLIELEEANLIPASNVVYYKLTDKGIVTLPSNSVIVGNSGCKFITDESGKVGAVLVSPPDIKYIRVGISNADFSSLDHQSIVFSSKKGLIIKTESGEYSTKKGESLKAEIRNNLIYLSVYKNNKDIFEKTADIGAFKGRIFVSSAGSEPVSIITLKRSSGYVPTYYGTLEMSIKDKNIRLTNEVGIEEYLRFVVPSEMPRYGGVEGYKVQAIAARTYVLSDMLSGRFAKLGFHVDDTTQSQVYNNQPSNISCDTAIKETAGKILSYNNKIIDAKYYSTSPGVGAPFNEVWYNNKEDLRKNPEPYLSFDDYTNSGIKDLSSEEAASNFLKDWTVKAYDSNSPYFRWKFEMDKTTLNNTINENIYHRYIKNPDCFKKKWFLNIYRKTVIPEEGIGNIKDITITKRGKSGIIMEAVISSDTGEYKVEKESNIRNLLTPKDSSFEITPLYGDKIKHLTSLPSAFFVIDKQITSGKLKGIVLYGGGYGHGAGMSQYGVIGLVRQGRKYDEILKIYYKDVKILDYENIIKSAF